MERVRVIFVASVLCLLAPVENVAFAGDCTALLEHGLRNIRITRSGEASLATKHEQFCRVEYENLSDAVKAHVDVEVVSIGGGNADVGVEKKKEMLKKWCAESKTKAEANKELYEEVQDFYKEAVAAWSGCNELKSRHVQMEPKITPDRKNVDVSLRYSGEASSGVLYMGYEADGFSCSESYATPAGPRPVPKDGAVYITNQAIKINCKRSPASEISRGGTVYRYLSSGFVTIKTAGSDMQLFFAEEWVPDLPTQEAEALRARLKSLEQKTKALEQQRVMDLLPRGVIVAWAAKSAIPSGWQVCDGSNGTPDLRNRYPMGTADNNVGQHLGTDKHGHGASGTATEALERRGWSPGRSFKADSGNGHYNHLHPLDVRVEESSHLPPSTRLQFIMKI